MNTDHAPEVQYFLVSARLYTGGELPPEDDSDTYWDPGAYQTPLEPRIFTSLQKAKEWGQQVGEGKLGIEELDTSDFAEVLICEICPGYEPKLILSWHGYDKEDWVQEPE